MYKNYIADLPKQKSLSVMYHSLLNKHDSNGLNFVYSIKPGFHYTVNATTTTQTQSDYKVEQSSFTPIALF